MQHPWCYIIKRNNMWSVEPRRGESVAFDNLELATHYAEKQYGDYEVLWFYEYDRKEGG